VLITDAMSATDAADGRYTLGRLEVDVHDGVATLADNGSLAGSTLTMDAAVRRAVHECGLSIVDASAAASGSPAKLLGRRHEFGAVERGLAGDLVVLDERLTVRAVLAGGEWQALGSAIVTNLVQTNPGLNTSTGLDH
jgi:N-acetylglucosamine-6-phosphate deacetylase